MTDGIKIRFATTPAFDRGIEGLIYRAGLNARKVVLVESGSLLKTLIKVTPPKQKEKTNLDIENKVFKKFNALDHDSGYSKFEGETSTTGLKYYGANSKYLFAGAPDSDMRKSDDRALLGVYYRTKSVQEHRRVIVDFKHPRRVQKVAILTRVITTKKQLVNLSRKIQSHVGRLKAGWFGPNGATWNKLNPTGGNMPPAWVTRHKATAQGWFVDGTGGNTPFPKFTMANTAHGIGNPRHNLKWVYENAMQIRAKAMAANALLFMSGKKKLADYGR